MHIRGSERWLQNLHHTHRSLVLVKVWIIMAVPTCLYKRRRLHTQVMSASVTLSPTRKVRDSRILFSTARVFLIVFCAASVACKDQTAC